MTLLLVCDYLELYHKAIFEVKRTIAQQGIVEVIKLILCGIF